MQHSNNNSLLDGQNINFAGTGGYAGGVAFAGRFSANAYGKEADMLRKLKQAYYKSNIPRRSLPDMT